MTYDQQVVNKDRDRRFFADLHGIPTNGGSAIGSMAIQAHRQNRRWFQKVESAVGLAGSQWIAAFWALETEFGGLHGAICRPSSR